MRKSLELLGKFIDNKQNWSTPDWADNIYMYNHLLIKMHYKICDSEFAPTYFYIDYKYIKWLSSI